MSSLLRVLVFLCLLNPLLANESLLERMQGLQKSLNPKLQGLYLSNKLRHVKSSYLQWLDTIPDSQFMAHLRVSHFGSMLVGHLMHHPRGSVTFRERYRTMVNSQMDAMLQVIDRYTRQLAFDSTIYTRLRPFVERYKMAYDKFMDKKISLAEFQLAEQSIHHELAQSATDVQMLDFMRILIFLEFQVLEYGLS